MCVSEAVASFYRCVLRLVARQFVHYCTSWSPRCVCVSLCLSLSLSLFLSLSLSLSPSLSLYVSLWLSLSLFLCLSCFLFLSLSLSLVASRGEPYCAQRTRAFLMGFCDNPVAHMSCTFMFVSSHSDACRARSLRLSCPFAAQQMVSLPSSRYYFGSCSDVGADVGALGQSFWHDSNKLLENVSD